MSGRVCFLWFLLIASASAQFDGGLRSMDHRVQVHVNFSNGECDVSTQVALMGLSFSPIAHSSTNRVCVADLFGVPAGTYRLVVSGRGFADVEAGEVSVGLLDTESIEVTVSRAAKRADETELSTVSTSVAGLKIPKQAAKEFDQANEQMGKRNWRAVIAALQKAIAIYPQYAAAYNNLGVAYARLGDRKREGEAFHQAISVDDHFAPAYVNLARMSIAMNAFSQAETDLKTAAALNPADGVTLILLAHAEYMNQQFDEAIANCREVHAMMRGMPHAWAHWVAAFAYEQKKQIAEAGAEFQTFVNENPMGERADDARKELVNIANFLSKEP